MMHISDLVISIAYFSIPIQLVVSLLKYPSLTRMQAKIIGLLILFALFIFLCGAGHLLRCLEKSDTRFFYVLNVFTSIVSLITAVYLLPLIPNLMGAIEKSMQDLVELNRETSESKSKLFTFMAFLCHEIRNPLFAITSSASFLSDTEMTEEQQIGIGSIQDASLLMLRLVNDVLDLSKIDAGKLELEQRDFDLHRLFENLNCNMKLQILQKSKNKVQFNFQMSEDVPKLVYGDSTRFLQIIYNLLSNSSKFTNQGHIGVKVSVCQSQTMKAMLEGFPDEIPDSFDSCFNTDNCCETCCESCITEDGGVKSLQDPSAATLNLEIESSTFDLMSSGSRVADASAQHDKHGYRKEKSFKRHHPENNRKKIAVDHTTHSSNSSLKCHKYVVLSVVVSDTGIGIPEKRIKTIFEPFSQAKLSDYREHGGTGLGLSIVYRLVKAMGGTIEVKSKDGEGTKFFLRLPIRVSHLNDRQKSEHDDTPEVPEVTVDMTDPLLTCQRLPVYSCSPQTKLESFSNDGILDMEEGNAKKEKDSCTARNLSTSSSSSVATSLLSKNDVTTATPEKEGDDQKGTLQNDTHHNSLANMVMVSKKRQNAAKPRLPSFEFGSLASVVLVVDDNCVNRKLIGRMLSFYNVEYRTAKDGAEAIQAIQESRNVTSNPEAPYYKLIFMDLSMPVMDGYEAIDQLRKDGIQIPIIALTANALAKERTRALDLGANEFRTKPIMREEIHALCSRFLLDDDDDIETGGIKNSASYEKIVHHDGHEKQDPKKPSKRSCYLPPISLL